MQKEVRFIYLTSPVPYEAMFQRQLSVRDDLVADKSVPTVFFLEHTPTITLGRRARQEHVLADKTALDNAGIALIPVDRGGDVTYHGPGQLVVYPILDLTVWRPSVDWYLRALEEVVIQVLAQYKLIGERLDQYTGVWVMGAKVAAIGVGVRQWHTWHGLALNIAPQKEHWRMIVPCGIQDKPVIALEDLLSSAPPLVEVVSQMREAFCRVFQCTGNLFLEEAFADHEQT